MLKNSRIFFQVNLQDLNVNGASVSYNLRGYHVVSKGKGKSVPLQAWSGAEGSRKLRFPDFMTTAQRGGKVVSHTHRPHIHTGNSPVLISVRG